MPLYGRSAHNVECGAGCVHACRYPHSTSTVESMALLLCPTRVCAPRLTVRAPRPPAARLAARRSRATAVRASTAAAAGGAHEPNPVRADPTCNQPMPVGRF